MKSPYNRTQVKEKQQNRKNKMNSKLLAKMKKLLAMAEGTANQEESMTAARHLQILLAKHQLTMSDVTEESADTKIETDSYEAENRPWVRILAVDIAKLYFCDVILSKQGVSKRKNAGFIFVGTEINRQTAISVFKMVKETILKESKIECKKAYGKVENSFITSFINSASVTISNRCKVLIDEAKDGKAVDDEGNTLPVLASVYDQQLAKVADFTKSNFNTKSVKNTASVSNGHGAAKGKQTGERIRLNNQKDMGNGNQKLLK